MESDLHEWTGALIIEVEGNTLASFVLPSSLSCKDTVFFFFPSLLCKDAKIRCHLRN
jgi:hypothetical protein